MTVAHVAQMLHGVLPMCQPADVAVRQAIQSDESEVLDCCRALSVLSTNHKAVVLDAAGSQVQSQGLPHVFSALEVLVRTCLAAGGVSHTSARHAWLVECTDMLLEAWSSILQPQCGYAMSVQAPTAKAADCAARTFNALVDAALTDAAAGAYEVSAVVLASASRGNIAAGGGAVAALPGFRAKASCCKLASMGSASVASNNIRS